MAWLRRWNDTRWSLLLSYGWSGLAWMGWWSITRSIPGQLQLSVARRSVPGSLLSALQFPAFSGQCQLLADQQLLPGESHVLLGESHLLPGQSPGELWGFEGRHQLQSQLTGHAVFPEQSQLLAHVTRLLHVLTVESQAPVERQLLPIPVHDTLLA